MANFSKTRREFLEMAAGTVSAAALGAAATPVLASAEPTGTVMSVRGPMDAKDLGFTLMHEHIYSDFTGYFYETQKDFDKIDKQKYFAADPLEPVQMKHLGYMNMGGYAFMRDAWSLRDRQVMLDELNYYKQVGGQSILEVSPWGKNQGPEYHLILKDLSEQTGINLICSTGLYGGDDTFWYDEAMTMTHQELTKTFLGHVNDGFGTTGVKAGHLKTAPNYWDENEQRAAQAIINAQKECGLMYTIHHGSKFDQAKAEEVHKDLAKMGSTPDRTVFAHMQSFVTNDNLRNQVTNPEGRFVVDLDFFKGVLDQGYTLSFDTFGTWVGFEIFEFLLDGDVPNAFEGNGGQSDVEVMAMVYFLCQQGYSDQIVLSQDCYAKNHLRTFGGVGYTRISNYVVPLFRNVGVKEEHIANMMVNTPARLLSKI
jgi:phosphotriesterase-related protein